MVFMYPILSIICLCLVWLVILLIVGRCLLSQLMLRALLCINASEKVTTYAMLRLGALGMLSSCCLLSLVLASDRRVHLFIRVSAGCMRVHVHFMGMRTAVMHAQIAMILACYSGGQDDKGCL